MRIATWNVNSLKARLDKVRWWLERARPDVLLMQETKLADARRAGRRRSATRGYELAHHGEGRWNGVAIASRRGIADVVTNFGEPLRPAQTPDAGDDEPLAEARMIAADVRRRARRERLRAERARGRLAVLRGQARLVRAARALAREARASPTSRSCSAATSTSRPRTPTSGTRAPATAARTSRRREREAFAQALPLGARRRLPAAPPRARPLHLVGLPRRQLPQELRHAHRPPAGDAARSRAARVWAEIDREARKGKPMPSDHAPLVDRPRRARASASTRAGRRPRAASPRGAGAR